ncbi:MAG: DUF1588 domain-containing protein, partial [Candidatus Omnitrophica bacterium]|nr:DUF1588 domain-containing protein [Candidatus Omnitrophota bacterium]
KRGVFLLDQILGTPAPPPPADVPDLEESEKAFKDREPTLRETLERHRSQSLCKSCHDRMDPLGLALENFNRAIELNPEYAIAYNNRAVLYCSIGKWELALKDFDTALKYEPDYVDPLKNRGIAYLILKDMKSAIRDFTRAIEKDPKNGELYNYRALSYLFENELSSAEKDIRIAVKLGYKIHPALKSLIETSRKP